jgi:hypothetical protein
LALPGTLSKYISTASPEVSPANVRPTLSLETGKYPRTRTSRALKNRLWGAIPSSRDTLTRKCFETPSGGELGPQLGYISQTTNEPL